MASGAHHVSGGGLGLVAIGAAAFGFFFFGNFFHLQPNPGTPLTSPLAGGGGSSGGGAGGGSGGSTGGGGAVAHAASPPSAGTGYTIQAGQTLSGIAQTQYGNASLWPGIYCYNRSRGTITTGPSSILAGTHIVLPSAATAQKLTQQYNANGGRCS